MDWDQNEELVEQILRTGMYAKQYDEETTYGYLTYLTYRVEDTLFTWKKKSDVDGFWADLTWEESVSYTHLDVYKRQVQLDDQGAVQNHRLTPEILKALSEQYFH